MNKKLLGLLTLPLVLSLGSCGHDSWKDEAPHTGEVATYDHVPSELTPVTEYEPKHILLDTVHVQADSYEINQTSYYSWTEAEGNFYVACEAMFVLENYTTYLHEIVLFAK